MQSMYFIESDVWLLMFFAVAGVIAAWVASDLVIEIVAWIFRRTK